MKDLKRNPANELAYVGKHKEKTIMNSIVSNKSNALIRYGNFSHEIIDGKIQYVFPPDKKVSDIKTIQKGLYLFNMVRKNAKDWLKKNPEFVLPKKNPVNQYNDNTAIDAKIAGTDLNNAYWEIAYQLGIITKYTYTKGLEDEKGFKQLRLAALSTLGAGKTYMVLKEGEISNDYVRIGYNERLTEVYKLIRYTCYKHMNILRRKLGKDFIAYRTDCIYYVNTDENRKMVQQYLKENGLPYKQLYDTKKPRHTNDGDQSDELNTA